MVAELTQRCPERGQAAGGEKNFGTIQENSGAQNYEQDAAWGRSLRRRTIKGERVVPSVATSRQSYVHGGERPFKIHKSAKALMGHGNVRKENYIQPMDTRTRVKGRVDERSSSSTTVPLG